MFKFSLALLALLIPAWTAQADEPVKPTFPVRVELIPEKPSILLGEPTYLKFRVNNPTDNDWQVGVGGDYRNSTGRPDSFTVAVTDEQGQLLSSPEKGWNFGGMFTTHTVPAQGHYDFNLFLPHWVTLSRPGKITICAKRTLALSLGKSFDRFLGNSTKVPVEATASLDVLPPDAQKLGALIDELGQRMLQGESEQTEAASYRLKAINDPRVVPYFVRAVERKQFGGIDMLGRYNDDSAFNTLKKAMLTTKVSITNATTSQVAEQSAANIRHTVANVLSHSPHPEALDFLLTQRHDPYYAVRLTAVHKMATFDAKRSVPLLEEMALDTNSTVSGEAKRYLEEIRKKHLTP